MEHEKLLELECMLVVLFKKLDTVERNQKGSSRSAPITSYYNELKQEAEKLKAELSKR